MAQSSLGVKPVRWSDRCSWPTRLSASSVVLVVLLVSRWASCGKTPWRFGPCAVTPGGPPPSSVPGVDVSSTVSVRDRGALLVRLEILNGLLNRVVEFGADFDADARDVAQGVENAVLLVLLVGNAGLPVAVGERFGEHARRCRGVLGAQAGDDDVFDPHADDRVGDELLDGRWRGAGRALRPAIGLMLTEAVTSLVRRQAAGLLLVVEHDGVFDPVHVADDFAEHLLAGDLEPFAGGFARFPRAALAQRVFEDSCGSWAARRPHRRRRRGIRPAGRRARGCDCLRGGGR